MSDVIEPIRAQRELSERWDQLALWVRRFVMCLLAAVVVVALCNVVGQRASTTQVRTAAAVLTVHAPTVVRPGLLFQARISITALEPLPDTQIVFGRGWAEGMTINTIEPSPSSETSGPDGSLAFDIGAIDPGQTFVQYLEFQVNPTSVSRRLQTLTVRSEGPVVVALNRTMTVVP